MMLRLEDISVSRRQSVAWVEHAGGLVKGKKFRNISKVVSLVKPIRLVISARQVCYSPYRFPLRTGM
jgi:hypothetical protein